MATLFLTIHVKMSRFFTQIFFPLSNFLLNLKISTVNKLIRQWVYKLKNKKFSFIERYSKFKIFAK